MKEEKILCKPSGVISISADLTAIQRKAYNVFLYYAKCAYAKNPAEEFIIIPLQELKDMIDDKSTDNKHLKESLSGIREAHVEFNSLYKDSAVWSDISLLSEIHIRIHPLNGKGIVVFALPPTIKKNIINNFLYAKIDLLIIKNLKSKYAIILYELIKDYKNVKIPKMKVEECKKLFGCGGKYEGRINQFQKKVLDPACFEINNNPDIYCKINYKITSDGIQFKFKLKQDEKEETSEALKGPISPPATSESAIKLPAILPITKELRNNPDNFVSIGDVFQKYLNKKSQPI